MQLLKWNLRGALPTATLVVIGDEYAEELIRTRENFTRPGVVSISLEGKFTVDAFGIVTPVMNVDPIKLKAAADKEKEDREQKKKLEVEMKAKEKAEKEAAEKQLDPEAEALKRSKDRAAKIQKSK